MPGELRPNIFPAVRYRDANADLEFLKAAFGADPEGNLWSFGTYDPYAPEAG